MNHKSLFTQSSSIQKTVQLLKSWQLIQYGAGKSRLCSLSGLSVVLAVQQSQCVAHGSTRSDVIADALHQQNGEPMGGQATLSPDSFSSLWAVGYPKEDSRHTETLISSSDSSSVTFMYASQLKCPWQQYNIDYTVCTTAISTTTVNDNTSRSNSGLLSSKSYSTTNKWNKM